MVTANIDRGLGKRALNRLSSSGSAKFIVVLTASVFGLAAVIIGLAVAGSPWAAISPSESSANVSDSSGTMVTTPALVQAVKAPVSSKPRAEISPEERKKNIELMTKLKKIQVVEARKAERLFDIKREAVCAKRYEMDKGDYDLHNYPRAPSQAADPFCYRAWKKIIEGPLIAKYRHYYKTPEPAVKQKKSFGFFGS